MWYFSMNQTTNNELLVLSHTLCIPHLLTTKKIIPYIKDHYGRVLPQTAPPRAMNIVRESYICFSVSSTRLQFTSSLCYSFLCRPRYYRCHTCSFSHCNKRRTRTRNGRSGRLVCPSGRPINQNSSNLAPSFSPAF